MPLLVETCGVDGLEEHLKEEFKANHIRIVLYMYRLCIARRVCIDLLVRWISSMTISKTHFSFHYTRNLFEVMLRSPETPSSKKDILTAFDFKNAVTGFFVQAAIASNTENANKIFFIISSP